MEGIAFTIATKSSSRIQWVEIHPIWTNEKDIIAFGYVATGFPCLQCYVLEHTNAFGFCWRWDWSYWNEGHGLTDVFINHKFIWFLKNDHDPLQGTKTMARGGSAEGTTQIDTMRFQKPISSKLEPPTKLDPNKNPESSKFWFDTT